MSVLTNPKYGMPTDNQTDTAAAIRICTAYWTAKIGGNWPQAHILRPTLSEEEHQEQFAGDPPEKVLGIGKPAIRKMGDDLVVPCQIKFKDGWPRTINLIVAFRKAKAPHSCVIAGARGSEAAPAAQEAVPATRPTTRKTS